MRRIFLPLLLASVAACSSREAPDKAVAVAAAPAQDLSLAGRSSAFVDTVAPYKRIESAPALGAAGPVRRTSVARRSTSSRSSVSTGRASSTSSASSAPAREPVIVVAKHTKRDAAIGAAASRDLPGGLAIAVPAGAQNVAPPSAAVPHVIVVSLVERPGTMLFAFEPANFTAQRGDTLRFVQTSATMHNVRFKTQPKGAKLGGAAISPYLTSKGQTYTIVVDSRFSEGKYELVCDPHEAIGMHGFLTVRGGTAP